MEGVNFRGFGIVLLWAQTAIRILYKRHSIPVFMYIGVSAQARTHRARYRRFWPAMARARQELTASRPDQEGRGRGLADKKEVSTYRGVYRRVVQEGGPEGAVHPDPGSRR